MLRSEKLLAAPIRLKRRAAMEVERRESQSLLFLKSMKQQVSKLQDARGMSKESHTFVSLMYTVLACATRAVYAVFHLMVALFPVSEIAIHVLSFSLERMCELATTNTKQDLVIKSIVFAMEILLTLTVVMFVFGSILFPVWMMGLVILSKLFSIAAGTWQVVVA